MQDDRAAVALRSPRPAGLDFVPARTGDADPGRIERGEAFEKSIRPGAEGVVEPQLLFYVDEKPAEELCDLDSDPHEIRNLADDSAFADTLKQHR